MTLRMRKVRPWVMALILSLTIAAVFMAPAAGAARGDDDHDRLRFYGWVESMPEGLHGTWIIGGQQVTTNPRTQLDQQEGPLRVGGCAKVDIRGGMVHEIDSEPAEDCR
jgi:Spy/CpxP family protein refolding chaperone